MQDWTYGVHIIDRETLRDLSILCNCQQVEARNWWVAFEDIEEQRCYGVCNTHYKKRIVHNSPEEAAKFINHNYNDLEKWWNSKLLQKAKNEFCYKFARQSNSPFSDLKRAMIDDI